VNTDLRAVVECLLTAHYSEVEIVGYLKGPFGLPEDEAVAAVRDGIGVDNSGAETDERSAT
jgi:hypothetical protein